MHKTIKCNNCTEYVLLLKQ